MDKIRRCSCTTKSAKALKPHRNSKVPLINTNGAAREYMEFELDVKAFKLVKAMARKQGQSPFEVCISLLREELSRLGGERGA